MEGVRCLDCKALIPEDPHGTKRCPACNAPIKTCRHCESYDQQQLDCTNLYRSSSLRISDPDEMSNCRYFSRILSVQPRRLRFSLLRTTTISLALALAGIYGATWLAQRLSQPVTPLPLRVVIGTPDTSLQSKGFDLQVLLFNPTDQPVEGVRIIISGRSLPHLTCQYTDPPESIQEAKPRILTAFAGDLLPAEHAAVRLHFVSKKTGELSLDVYVTAASASSTKLHRIALDVLP